MDTSCKYNCKQCGETDPCKFYVSKSKSKCKACVCLDIKNKKAELKTCLAQIVPIKNRVENTEFFNVESVNAKYIDEEKIFSMIKQMVDNKINEFIGNINSKLNERLNNLSNTINMKIDQQYRNIDQYGTNLNILNEEIESNKIQLDEHEEKIESLTNRIDSFSKFIERLRVVDEDVSNLYKDLDNYDVKFKEIEDKLDKKMDKENKSRTTTSDKTVRSAPSKH